MLNICTLNLEQDTMISAFMELQKACYQKQLADCKSWELRLDLDAFAAYQLEWQKAFENRTQKREEAYALVARNPELAADLIERLINQIHEEKVDGGEPVVHARWDNVQETVVDHPHTKITTTNTAETCSACQTRVAFVGSKRYLNDKRCPECGAKMDL